MEGNWEEGVGTVKGGSGQGVSFLEVPVHREPEVVSLGNDGMWCGCVVADLKERQLVP